MELLVVAFLVESQSLQTTQVEMVPTTPPTATTNRLLNTTTMARPTRPNFRKMLHEIQAVVPESDYHKTAGDARVEIIKGRIGSAIIQILNDDLGAKQHSPRRSAADLMMRLSHATSSKQRLDGTPDDPDSQTTARCMNTVKEWLSEMFGGGPADGEAICAMLEDLLTAHQEVIALAVANIWGCSKGTPRQHQTKKKHRDQTRRILCKITRAQQESRLGEISREEWVAWVRAVGGTEAMQEATARGQIPASGREVAMLTAGWLRRAQVAEDILRRRAHTSRHETRGLKSQMAEQQYFLNEFLLHGTGDRMPWRPTVNTQGKPLASREASFQFLEDTERSRNRSTLPAGDAPIAPSPRRSRRRSSSPYASNSSGSPNRDKMDVEKAKDHEYFDREDCPMLSDKRTTIRYRRAKNARERARALNDTHAVMNECLTRPFTITEFTRALGQKKHAGLGVGQIKLSVLGSMPRWFYLVPLWIMILGQERNLLPRKHMHVKHSLALQKGTSETKYRTISLSMTFQKLIDSMMALRLSTALAGNEQLDEEQGFPRGKSQGKELESGSEKQKVEEKEKGKGYEELEMGNGKGHDKDEMKRDKGSDGAAGPSSPRMSMTQTAFREAGSTGVSILTAMMATHAALREGHLWLIAIDVAKFYDSIEYQTLELECNRLGIDDASWAYLHAALLGSGRWESGFIDKMEHRVRGMIQKTAGLAQGAPPSCPLAIVAVDAIDGAILVNYVRTRRRVPKRRRPRRVALRQVLTRYCDDLLGIVCTRDEAKQFLEILGRGFCESRWDAKIPRFAVLTSDQTAVSSSLPFKSFDRAKGSVITHHVPVSDLFENVHKDKFLGVKLRVFGIGEHGKMRSLMKGDAAKAFARLELLQAPPLKAMWLYAMLVQSRLAHYQPIAQPPGALAAMRRFEHEMFHQTKKCTRLWMITVDQVFAPRPFGLHARHPVLQMLGLVLKTILVTLNTNDDNGDSMRELMAVMAREYSFLTAWAANLREVGVMIVQQGTGRDRPLLQAIDPYDYAIGDREPRLKFAFFNETHFGSVNFAPLEWLASTIVEFHSVGEANIESWLEILLEDEPEMKVAADDSEVNDDDLDMGDGETVDEEEVIAEIFSDGSFRPASEGEPARMGACAFFPSAGCPGKETFDGKRATNDERRELRTQLRTDPSRYGTVLRAFIGEVIAHEGTSMRAELHILVAVMAKVYLALTPRASALRTQQFGAERKVKRGAKIVLITDSDSSIGALAQSGSSNQLPMAHIFGRCNDPNLRVQGIVLAQRLRQEHGLLVTFDHVPSHKMIETRPRTWTWKQVGNDICDTGAKGTSRLPREDVALLKALRGLVVRHLAWRYEAHQGDPLWRFPHPPLISAVAEVIDAAMGEETRLANYVDFDHIEVDEMSLEELDNLCNSVVEQEERDKGELQETMRWAFWHPHHHKWALTRSIVDHAPAQRPLACPDYATVHSTYTGDQTTFVGGYELFTRIVAYNMRVHRARSATQQTSTTGSVLRLHEEIVRSLEGGNHRFEASGVAPSTGHVRSLATSDCSEGWRPSRDPSHPPPGLEFVAATASAAGIVEVDGPFAPPSRDGAADCVVDPLHRRLEFSPRVRRRDTGTAGPPSTLEKTLAKKVMHRVSPLRRTTVWPAGPPGEEALRLTPVGRLLTRDPIRHFQDELRTQIMINRTLHGARLGVPLRAEAVGDMLDQYVGSDPMELTALEVALRMGVAYSPTRVIRMKSTHGSGQMGWLERNRKVPVDVREEWVVCRVCSKGPTFPRATYHHLLFCPGVKQTFEQSQRKVERAIRAQAASLDLDLAGLVAKVRALDPEMKSGLLRERPPCMCQPATSASQREHCTCGAEIDADFTFPADCTWIRTLGIYGRPQRSNWRPYGTAPGIGGCPAAAVDLVYSLWLPKALTYALRSKFDPGKTKTRVKRQQQWRRHNPGTRALFEAVSQATTTVYLLSLAKHTAATAEYTRARVPGGKTKPLGDITINAVSRMGVPYRLLEAVLDLDDIPEDLRPPECSLRTLGIAKLHHNALVQGEIWRKTQQKARELRRSAVTKSTDGLAGRQRSRQDGNRWLPSD